MQGSVRGGFTFGCGKFGAWVSGHSALSTERGTRTDVQRNCIFVIVWAKPVDGRLKPGLVLAGTVAYARERDDIEIVCTPCDRYDNKALIEKDVKSVNFWKTYRMQHENCARFCRWTLLHAGTEQQRNEPLDGIKPNSHKSKQFGDLLLVLKYEGILISDIRLQVSNQRGILVSNILHDDTALPSCFFGKMNIRCAAVRQIWATS